MSSRSIIKGAPGITFRGHWRLFAEKLRPILLIIEVSKYVES